MNPKIKELARQAGHIARTTANEIEDSKTRELAVAVFGLAFAVERIAECLPDLPENPQKQVKPASASASASKPAGKRIKA